MPIFEDGERISSEKLRKEQELFNEKMFRLATKKLWEEQDTPPPVFENGDLPLDHEDREVE